MTKATLHGAEAQTADGKPRLVLASASAARRSLLEAAGVPFEVEKAAIDEDAVKMGFKAEQAPVEDVAVALAEIKARRVARRLADRLVIGADQMLACEGMWFDKPADLDHARAHLQALRGKTHELISAVVVVHQDNRLWHHVERARLTMRPVSDSFIDRYLEVMGDKALASVGAYQLEGIGAQLFDKVEGDYFTVLGLPLLPLLDYLRVRKVLAS